MPFISITSSTRNGAVRRSWIPNNANHIVFSISDRRHCLTVSYVIRISSVKFIESVVCRELTSIE